MRDPAYIAAWSASLAQHVRAAEAQPTTEASRSTLTTTRRSTKSTPSPGVEVMRSSAPALAALRTLPQSSLLLLLTPVLPTDIDDVKPGLSRSKTAIDPFEPLGRELATHHPRIRHVPFLPNAGLSTVHRGFLQEADAVILVISTSDDTSSLLQQQTIAGEMASLAHGSAILVLFGDAVGIKDARVLDAYANVIRAGQLDKRTFETIARTLFETRK
ncbi:hypothetical protein B0A48_15315 [Cryoendolithus antarcticus]|uniref:Uncharacterized protein n=1 Tax=Cryoendolithus antarcticus TaxID=1507870 RepID=A0A1V8SHU3_9PEZI|nr:hypothetical protein B0A48_15315 [Cryoendolithus antarcticus]